MKSQGSDSESLADRKVESWFRTYKNTNDPEFCLKYSFVMFERVDEEPFIVYQVDNMSQSVIQYCLTVDIWITSR